MSSSITPSINSQTSTFLNSANGEQETSSHANLMQDDESANQWGISEREKDSLVNHVTQLLIKKFTLNFLDPVTQVLGPESEASLLLGNRLQPNEDVSQLKNVAIILRDVHKDLAQFPLIIAYCHILRQFLGVICEKHPSFCSQVMKKQGATLSEVVTFLLVEIDLFIRTKDSKKLIHFLKVCSEFVKKEMKNVPAGSAYLFEMGVLFLSFHPHSLHHSLLSILEPNRPVTAIERYYHAVKGYEILTSSLHYLTIANLNNKADELVQKAILVGNKITIKSTTHELLKTTPFTKSQRIDIASLGYRLINAFYDEECLFSSNNKFLLFEETYDDSNSLLATGMEQLNAAMEQRQFLGVDYIEKNQSHFSSLIPRLKEIEAVLVPQAKALAEQAAILKDFYIYLSLGNHERCKQKLEATPSQFKEIFFNEIRAFSVEIKLNRVMALNVIQSINEGDASLKARKVHVRRYFSQQENYYNHFVVLCQALLTSPLSLVEKSFSDLFIYRASITPQGPARPNKTREKKEEATELVASSPRPVSEISEPLTQTSGTRSSSLPKITDPFFLMKEIQEQEKAIWQELVAECSGFQTREALINCKAHLDGILSLFHLYIHQSKTSISKNQFKLFVMECVRHGSLASEQLLSALDRQINEIQNAEELKEHLNHSLFSILIQCKVKPPIPHSIREWVRDNDKGEYLVRNPNKCKLGNSSLENLLSKVLLFCRGNEAFSPEDILVDLSKYLQGVVDLCVSIIPKISLASREHLPQFKSAFKSVCNIISECPLTVSNSKSSSPVFPEIDSMKMAIESFYSQTSSVTIRNSLSNVLDHQLDILEAEMASQQSLNPISSYNHCSHAFLLTQMIAESVMLCLIDHQMIDAVFEDEKQHDLFAMVEALGMNREEFTQAEYDFLSRGKQTRMLVRYKASYDKIPKKERLEAMASIEKTLQLAKQISSKQPYEHYYKTSDGFQSTYAFDLERVKQDVFSDVSTLNSVLAKCFSKIGFDKITA